jgi:hypothetical protein
LLELRLKAPDAFPCHFEILFCPFFFPRETFGFKFGLVGLVRGELKSLPKKCVVLRTMLKVC